MDSIGVETLVDGVCHFHEGVHTGLLRSDVRRCESLVLVQPPDVELVDGHNAFDLSGDGRENCACYRIRVSGYLLPVQCHALHPAG